MDKVVLPNNRQTVPVVQKHVINDSLALGTTAGLKRTDNEDRLGCLSTHKSLRIVIADGHWGVRAAELVLEVLLDEHQSFPKNRNSAISLTKDIELQLVAEVNGKWLDPDKDRPPEAAFLAAEIKEGQIKAFGYGDCRLVIGRQGHIIHRVETNQTWLGVFSSQGSRGRLSIEEALTFNNFKLDTGDVIHIFTDGVDECIYEKATINLESIVRLTEHKTAEASLDAVLTEIMAKGAEDNASLVILRNK